MKRQIALMLPGGGARAAYQVGALKAIAEINASVRRNADDCGAQYPFPITTGTSAGAVNATVLAAHGHSLVEGVQRLEHFWRNLRCSDVYRTDLRCTAATSVRWLGSMLFGFFGITPPASILDTQPLRTLLNRELQIGGIQRSIDSGHLHALSVTASSYTSAHAVSFFQGCEGLQNWQSGRRRLGVRTRIGVEHLLASTALPIIFPSVKIDAECYGDGGMRHTAPLSTAIRLGAERILIIGTRNEIPDDPHSGTDITCPSIGEIGGHLLDIIFMDSLHADLARLRRINHTLDVMPPENRPKTGLKHIRTLMLHPSEDLRDIAHRHIHRVPGTVRFLLRRIGSTTSARMPSYLLFEAGYCCDLIEIGYRDTRDRKEEILEFLQADEQIH